MSNPAPDTARKQADRIAVLERRMRQLVHKPHKSPTNIGEISAIEWALPILEKHLYDTYGVPIAIRASWHKHEKVEIMAELWERDGDICYLCDHKLDPKTATIDHVIPLSKGGKDAMSNYKLTHAECNIGKGNMMPEVFFERKRKGLVWLYGMTLEDKERISGLLSVKAAGLAQ